MGIKENIAKVIDEFGATVIAQRMGIDVSQRVFNWKSRGVPLDQAVEFCKAVDWKITPHQLYPKNYPNAHDGLPDEYRKAA